MARNEFFEDYFVRLNKKFGITKIDFNHNKLFIEDKDLRNMIFASENFNEEYEVLKKKCKNIYLKLKRDFFVRIKRDMSNNYHITIV